MTPAYHQALGTSTVQRQCPLDATSGAALLASLQALAKQINDTDGVFLLIHTDAQVYIGTLHANDLPLNPLHLQELRLFSKTGEFHLWKHGRTFFNRLRIDQEQAETQEPPETFYVHEEAHILWGTNVEHSAGWSLLKEDRGTNLRVPFPNITIEQLPLRYTVKNYATFDENGILQFKDARLVNFMDRHGRSLMISAKEA